MYILLKNVNKKYNKIVYVTIIVSIYKKSSSLSHFIRTHTPLDYKCGIKIWFLIK